MTCIECGMTPTWWVAPDGSHVLVCACMFDREEDPVERAYIDRVMAEQAIANGWLRGVHRGIDVVAHL